ncbi:PREDICTED: pancreatic triacylglycerol lipase-like isoform X3 [Polistes dominula]|uniref:phospholipase A1 n=1 Tax=Polistes dominula TaxID=743375 RepID=A0ABM1JDA4_POLDO|nr:PREDICTED: pancreatic triacylglycerol lipase-like isoform X3 [Polistes dominula]XP_015190442.1 PREDICTED: pancreatic triacylglycerol lipase-like isoform X3 [Polistes dominula]
MFLLNLLIKAIIFLLSCNLVISKEWESGLRERYDGYGEDWIFMPDGNGLPQVAILKYEDNARNILDNKHISYILYTRFGPENGTKLMINDTAGLLNSDFKASRKTKFITHGWKSSSMSSGFINMKEAYLQHDDYNIILVDWEPLAASTFYLGPMQNTVSVGKDAANFIDFLVSETGLRVEDVHFLGHSLGAHVAGNVGSAITSGKLGRITGFDPALPGFHLLTSDKTRLDLTDATFVDVIHSCGGILGYLQPVGKVDFYPNAGTAVQPGCCCVPEVMEACSHGRSYIYFTESINSKTGFSAVKCKNWDRFVSGDCSDSEAVLMGEHVDKSANGSYFLRTRSESPYAYMPEITSNDI